MIRAADRTTRIRRALRPTATRTVPGRQVGELVHLSPPPSLSGYPDRSGCAVAFLAVEADDDASEVYVVVPGFPKVERFPVGRPRGKGQTIHWPSQCDR